MKYFVIGTKKTANGIVEKLVYFTSNLNNISCPQVFEEIDVETAILFIENDNRCFKTVYFDLDTLKVGTDIEVVNEQGKKYLRSNSNSKTVDNLDRLPIFKS